MSVQSAVRAGARTVAAAMALAALAVGLVVATPRPAQAAGDDYPWRADQSWSVDSWGFTRRQCVSFVAWRAAQNGAPIRNDGWGDAARWDEAARRTGLMISTRPKPGAIAQWNAHERSDWVHSGRRQYYAAGAYGHVAWVAGVYSDGRVVLASYNADGRRSYGVSTGRAPRYIYLR